jgi:uncharacterized integral membrane protein
VPTGDRISVDSLIREALAGKAVAVAKYDEMIWKIRTGYAVLLYGAIGIVAGLVNQKAVSLESRVAWAAVVLIIGFSVFGALLDYSFMAAKLRVIKYRDRLIELAWSRAISAQTEEAPNAELLECLKNSGERKERTDWSRRVGRPVPLIYYGGTGLVCSVAARLLAA